MPIHVIEEDERGEGYEIWLDTEVAKCDGLCIGSNATRNGALREAAETLTMALRAIVRESQKR
jgi:hypothetical protein